MGTGGKLNSSSDQNERSTVQTRRLGRESLFSPKTVAKAIGVSESSLKRWCDAGKISAMKTAGGHRRLRQSQVVSFLRERKKYELLDPESIGLPDLAGISVSDLADAATQFHQGLVAEDESKCHRLLMFLYVNGWAMEEIVDQVICPAFKQIGTQWQHGSLEVYQERRACEICFEGLTKLKGILNQPEANALTAIGSTVEHDHYTLCTKSIEVALASHGWNATSLGTHLPYATLLQAALTKRPDLMWLSVSYLKEEETFVRDLNLMAEQIPKSTTLVVGGNAIKPWFWPKIQNAIYTDNLVQLIASIKHIKRPIEPPGSALL